jgi:hypothetical protein
MIPECTVCGNPTTVTEAAGKGQRDKGGLGEGKEEFMLSPGLGKNSLVPTS